MKHLYIVTLLALTTVTSVQATEHGKHLFILSGQSNMAKLDPTVSFIPTVEAEFGKENVIVVKHGQNGQPIRRWYKNWKPVQGDEPKATGDLYDLLMGRVNPAIQNEDIQTVTFVWMQGECDAKEKNFSVYKDSVLGLVQQLRDDMKRDDINYVIGRLSQYSKSQGWMAVRVAQVEAAEASPRGAWVDTDDIDIKGIHYTPAGYKELGKRFAEQAIELIKKQQEHP